MKFRTKTKISNGRSAESLRAFTLAEVLAAMVFMAIVIPVAIEAIHIAGQAGAVAQRKTLALQVAEEMLNNTVVNCQSNQNQTVQAFSSGTTRRGAYNFNWTVKSSYWNSDSTNMMDEVTSEVTYTAQNREYTVHLTTLVAEPY